MRSGLSKAFPGVKLVSFLSPMWPGIACSIDVADSLPHGCTALPSGMGRKAIRSTTRTWKVLHFQKYVKVEQVTPQCWQLLFYWIQAEQRTG